MIRTPARRPAGRLLAAAAALAVGATLAGGLTGPAAAAAGDYPAGVQVDPATLPRGADTVALHSAGHSIVDGDRTVRTDLPGRLRLVGRAVHGYVVVTSDRSGEHSTLWRVRRDGSARRLRALVDGAADARTSPDGARVAWTVQGRHRTRVLVARTTDGSLVGSVRRRGYLEVVDVARRVLVTGVQPDRTLWVRPAAGTTERAMHRPVWDADIAADRAVVAVQDLEHGYDGICLSLRRLSDPSIRWWRTCTDKPLAFSPDGTLMVTTDIRSDGIGPNLLQLRDATTNTVLATYRTAGYFGNPVWEDDDSFVVRDWADGHVAQVRITTDGTVERVSRVVTAGAEAFSALWWTFPAG